MRPRFYLIGLLVLGMTTVAEAEGPIPAYLGMIGAADRRDTIETVRTEAHVTVSDGLEFDTLTLLHDAQHAILHQVYEDRTSTVGIEGMYFWSFDGKEQKEGPPFYGVLVMGHQFHGQILFFDELNGPVGPPHTVECGDSRCLAIEGENDLTLHLDVQTQRPTELILDRGDEPDVRASFSNWRVIDGIELPFHVSIDDGESTFEYEFRAVTFNEGDLDEFRAPMELLTDEQQLLRLHRIAMDAHLFEDATMMDGLFADGIVASAGEIYRPTSEETDTMMARILSNRDHARYDDLIRPIVKVSADGTLGWVIVQVEAEGVRLDENRSPSGPLQFTSAWVSLFEKIDGTWKQIGNVSNFKPEGE